MYCYKCGFKLPENAVFCPKCGTDVSGISIDDDKAEETVTDLTEKIYDKDETSIDKIDTDENCQIPDTEIGTDLPTQSEAENEASDNQNIYTVDFVPGRRLSDEDLSSAGDSSFELYLDKAITWCKDKWLSMSRFNQIILSAFAVSILLDVVASSAGRWLSVIIAVLQMVCIGSAYVINRRGGKEFANKIHLYLLLAAAVLFLLYFISFPVGASKVEDVSQVNQQESTEQKNDESVNEKEEPHDENIQPEIAHPQKSGKDDSFKLQFEIDCAENQYFSTYDVNVYIEKAEGKEFICTIPHGSEMKNEAMVPAGKCNILFTSSQNEEVCGRYELDIKESCLYKFDISCAWYGIDIQNTYYESMRPLEENEIKIVRDYTAFLGKSYIIVQKEFSDMGFKNVSAVMSRDLSDDNAGRKGQVSHISVGGNDKFNDKEILNLDDEVIITYHEGQLSADELRASEEKFTGGSAPEFIEAFEDMGYNVKCYLNGSILENDKCGDYSVALINIDSEEGIYSISADIVKNENIEETLAFLQRLPREKAFRVLITAITNERADDVFRDDGCTYDLSKFHSYSDLSGFYVSVVDEGVWHISDRESWIAEEVLCKVSKGSAHVKTDAEIINNGNDYIVSKMGCVIAAREYIDSNDLSKIDEITYESSESNPFLKVTERLIAEERDKAKEKELEEKAAAEARAAEERQQWIESQFSSFSGEHRELKKLIKENLNDEKSYRHEDTNYIDISSQEMCDEINAFLNASGYTEKVKTGDILIICEFSAKNAFNGRIKNTAVAIAHYDTDTLILVGIE